HRPHTWRRAGAARSGDSERSWREAPGARFASDRLFCGITPRGAPVSMTSVTIDDVRLAEPIIRRHFSSTPLIRSYALEQELGFPEQRRVWIKDFGWTPAGSFKLYGGLNWMAHHAGEIGDRPVVAHSSGNFASGIAYA